MKGAFLVGILLSGFFVFAANVVMTQIKSMEDFYSNMDQYTTNALNSQNAIAPQPLQNMMHPNGQQLLPSLSSQR